MADIVGWSLIAALFAVGMVGAVYPILPGVLAIYGAFFVYGFFAGFDEIGFWFWLIQSSIALAILAADYAVNTWGVKKFGGSRASVIGSTIGLIVGPFVIPAAGLILGPLLGAFIGELLIGSVPRKAMYAAIGALVGFFSSTIMKILLQLLMIILFLIWIIF